MVIYYDFEDKKMGGEYDKKPDRDFSPDEKYYMDGDKKVSNSKFKLNEAKIFRNKHIRAYRMKSYPPLADLAAAIYWDKKGDSSKMDKYISDCDKVKNDNPFL